MEGQWRGSRKWEKTYREQADGVDGLLVNLCVAHDCGLCALEEKNKGVSRIAEMDGEQRRSRRRGGGSNIKHLVLLNAGTFFFFC